MHTTSVDVDAITAIINDTERAFNTGDAALLAAQFHEDAWAVGVNGRQLAGRQQILDASRRLFAGALRGQRARYEIDELRFLSPEVAVLRKHAHAIDGADGDADVGHAMVALYVMAKRDGVWRVVARQNTLVQP
jgi:uncharacterized protein (TIGR02246 family)